MDECVQQFAQKYTTRPSPPFPANKCPKRQMRGNDGLMYSSVPDKNGVHRWQLTKGGDAEILTWDQLCKSRPITPIGLNASKFKSLLNHGIWLKDTMEGFCTSYRRITKETVLPGVEEGDVQIREVQVPFIKALMPEEQAELILSKISDTIAYKIEALNGDEVVKYRTSQDGYIPLRYSCARTASGETHMVDADFDLEPVSALQKIIQRDGADLNSLSGNIRERAIKDDMLQRQIVYIYLIGKPCDGRDLVAECLNTLAAKKADVTKERFIAKDMTRGVAIQPAAAPKRFVAPEPVPVVDAKAELDAMTVFYTDGFEGKRQTAIPSGNNVGILIVTQPVSTSEYMIKFVTNGRQDVIERIYITDKAAGKEVFGRIFDKNNDRFVGLLEGNW